MRTRRVAGRAVALVGLFIIGVTAAQGTAAQPVWDEIPTPAERAQAEATIRELLGEVLLAETRDGLRAASAQLLDVARGTRDDSAARYVLLEFARDRAVRAADPELMTDIIREMNQHYLIDALQMRLAALREMRNTSPPDARVEEIRAHASQLMQEALARDRLELAEDAHHLVAEMAALDAPAGLVESLAQQEATLEEVRDIAEAARQAALLVLQHPDDPAANDIVGRYLCLVKGDWRAGLKHLAKSNDARLQRLARLESHQPAAAHTQMELADGWREYAAEVEGLFRRSALAHAEDLYRSAYPEISGLTRLKLEQKMRSRSLLAFDSDNPPAQSWVDEHFTFRGGHGREGAGSWANYGVHGGQRLLVANKAGWVTTAEPYPPQGVTRWRIEAEVWSDLLTSTALEFAGERMYFGGAGGIHLEGGWTLRHAHPITAERYHTYVIDVSADGISFMVDGEPVGTKAVSGGSVPHGVIALRGWEGHVRCRRLAVWAMPDDDLTEGAIVNPLLESAGQAEFRFYDGFDEDLSRLRETIPLGDPAVRASSGEAVAAAARVFKHFPKRGDSRARVLELLGDPATISDYGVPMSEVMDSPLIYRFDSGFAGVQYTVHFENARVTRIEPVGID